jgi:hypothetical protein
LALYLKMPCGVRVGRLANFVKIQGHKNNFGFYLSLFAGNLRLNRVKARDGLSQPLAKSEHRQRSADFSLSSLPEQINVNLGCAARDRKRSNERCHLLANNAERQQRNS